MDIIGVYVKTNSDGTLNLALETAGEPPSTWDPVAEEIVFGFYLDTTGDHSPDYQVLLQNDFDNQWNASLSELTTGQTLSGDRFPGVGGVIGTDGCHPTRPIHDRRSASRGREWADRVHHVPRPAERSPQLLPARRHGTRQCMAEREWLDRVRDRARQLRAYRRPR